LGDLASPAGEQARCAWIVFFANAIEGVVKAGDFCRIRPDLYIIAGKHHLYGGVVPYQGSHVSSLHSQVGYAPTRVERRTAP
jgi:hypothetical protein